MFKYIASFFAFLLPIARKAAVEVAADLLHEKAYGRRPVRPYTPYTRYDRRTPRTQREATMNVGRAVREADEFGKFKMPLGFHDVLMVAFDLTAPNAYEAHRWLMDNMPATGPGGDNDEINLDSWWVANDQRFDRSDTDSAVFVKKGKQEEARRVLKEAGLVD